MIKKEYLQSHQLKKEYIEDFKRVIEDLDNNKVNIIQYFCQNKINSLYKVIIQKAIDKNEQILLLFPTHQMAKHYFSILNNEFYNKVTYYDSTKNKTSRWQEINKLSQNETGIIIGTKLSLFLPFKNLKKIVVVDYESEHYIQDDQTPRYNLIHLVKDLKKNNNDIRTIFSTNLPLVNDVLEKNKIIRLSLNYPTPPVVLNMNDELKEAKHYFLSFPLIENIKDCINKKQKLILFSNKKGFSNTIICRDCNHIFKCPKCSFNLSFDTQKTICKKCNFSQNIISFCNNCHGNNIKQIAFGTKKLKNIMDIEFPDLKTICLDSDFEKDNDNLLNNYDCYIVTQYYLDNYYELPIHNIGLISIVHLDSILNQPSYNTQERAYSLIMNMYSLAISKNAKFILQTFLYDNYVMSSFRSQDLKYYYKNELQNRKDFNYPPYGELIYLINKGENENTTLNEANSILQKLIKEFDSNENILIIGPNQNTKQHNKYIFSIIIKILNKDSYNGFSNKINMILPPKWIIHINPNKPLNLVN